jgi:alpha-D-xyloside xylohydrolase
MTWAPGLSSSAYGSSYRAANGADQAELGSSALLSGTRETGYRHLWRLAHDEDIFGGGESYQGPNLRGRLRHGVNVETHGIVGLDLAYLNVPMFWSNRGWGVFANTGAPTVADVGSTDVGTMALDIDGPVLDLFFYWGSPKEILQAHWLVTGAPPVVPTWALGVWTSRCSYLNADEVGEVLDGYRVAECPVSVVHIDSWQPGNLLRDLTTVWEVDRDRWPVGWSSSLRASRVRLCLWHNPYLRRGTAAGDEACAAGLVLADSQGCPVVTNDMPDRLLVDFTNPEAVRWWHEHVRALVTAEGASALKADFGEEVPPEAIAFDGRTGWELRNEYAVMYQRETALALTSLDVADGFAMFCRSGSAGAQRYPCHWVGDSISTWAGLQASFRACLSLSLSGFAYVSHDIGGFWSPDTYEVAYEASDNNDPDLYLAEVEPELFVRWTQWGALTPLMRFHGCGRREPWAYPEPYGAAAVRACQLRERLMSYLEMTSAEVASRQLPMMRPLPLVLPERQEARQAAHLEYFLGGDVLVAPVLEPGGQVSLWVPPGEWVGLDGAPTFAGPRWVDTTLSLEVIPAWSRKGKDVLA